MYGGLMGDSDLRGNIMLGDKIAQAVSSCWSDLRTSADASFDVEVEARPKMVGTRAGVIRLQWTRGDLRSFLPWVSIPQSGAAT